MGFNSGFKGLSKKYAVDSGDGS